MKPVRLTLQAFGPYPDQVSVDFRQAVEAGLFGIYGQTGSGKSTLFSAMTFALFGEPAKEEQDARSLRSDLASPAALTEVEFVFDLAGRRYTVLRRPEQMRLKARGEGETRSAHEAYLFDATGLEPEQITPQQRGRIIAEKKVGDVDAAIIDLLGYGARQFRQIVLLPQGRFEAFLAAKTGDRLKILRDLFDVSSYEALMDSLKSSAAAAVQKVREERALCDRQLQAEGFETLAALEEGITGAQTRHAELEAAEADARTRLEAADLDLRQAEALAEKFTQADQTALELAKLEALRPEIEALAERVRQAERARTLLDVEERAAEALRDVDAAEKTLQQAVRIANAAAAKAAEAESALKREEERSGEAEALRRKKDDLERYVRVLASAAESGKAAEAAQQAQNEAQKAFETAQSRLDRLRDERKDAAAALKTSREREAERAALMERLRGLDARHTAARAYEAALAETLTARSAAEDLTKRHEAASERNHKARQVLDAAERGLAAAQALHLATKLADGQPCPVCGSASHPAPATGTAGGAGLDQAFRQARKAFEDASQEVRTAAEALAGARATLAGCETRLAGLTQPEETAKALARQITAEQKALAALGAGADSAAAEARCEALDSQIGGEELDRDRLRDQFEACRNKATAAWAARDGMLAEVPLDLRQQEALSGALRLTGETLNGIIAARAAAEAAVRSSREAALGAGKDQESADNALSACRERHTKAANAFAGRLSASGLSAETFQALKPAIATLEADRSAVDAFWLSHRSAADAAQAAALAVEGMSRPQTSALREAHAALAADLTRATGERAAASSRAEHLQRLKAGLEDSLRRLEKTEAATAPLRELAALTNGSNPQKLTLETFAIGAMFDQVLEAANLRLGPMTSSRYRLERDTDGSGGGKRGLGIQVFDMYTGKPRSTGTLSGGESFIAALALALGLADVVESASGKVRLDTIFIDEGFGSLDTENGSGTLDQVLNVLGSLVRQNRAVGLISHVPLVQEAIPNGFYVKKSAGGSSIEERGAG
jgi:exonuclease SbcC